MTKVFFASATWLFFTLFNFSLLVAQPLSGTYTIGGNNPDFATIGSAFSALSSRGIASSVIFNIRDGIYNEQLVYNAVPGASIDWQISFQSESFDNTAVVIEYENDGIHSNVLLNNPRNLSFKNLTFRNSSTTQAHNIVELAGSVLLLSFLNNRFETNAGAYNEYPVYGEPDTLALVHFYSNYFQGGHYGVYLAPGIASGVGVLLSVFDSTANTAIYLKGIDNVSVHSNKIRGHHSNGVFVEDANGVSIVNNEFDSLSGSAIYIDNINGNVGVNQNIVHHKVLDYGVYVGGGIYLPKVKIDNNFIHNAYGYGIVLEGASSAIIEDNTVRNDTAYENAYGISLSDIDATWGEEVRVKGNRVYSKGDNTGISINHTQASSALPTLLANNMVAGFAYLLELHDNDYLEVANNSISGFGTVRNAFYAERNTNTTISNNAVKYVLSAGSPTYDIVYLDNDTSITMDHNSYYYDVTNTSISLTTFATDLAAQQANGKDLNAIMADPLYFNDTFDLQICSGDLYGAGAPVANLPTDMFTTPRSNTAPTIGAQELLSDIPKPIARFTYTNVYGAVTFVNTTGGATSYLWEFGDGTVSNAVHPEHEFLDTSITYEVRLIANSPCGMDTTTAMIDFSVGIDNTSLPLHYRVFPNPITDIVNIELHEVGVYRISLIAMDGRVLRKQAHNIRTSKIVTLETDELPAGVYLLAIENEQGQTTVHKLVK